MLIINHNNSSGRYLFELLPDLFPDKNVSEIEQQVWYLFQKEREENKET